MFDPSSIRYDLAQAIRMLIGKNSIGNGYVRITVTGGSDLDYPSGDHLVVAITKSMDWSQKMASIAVVTIDNTRDVFRHVKTTNRLVSTFALREAVRVGADEAIFLDNGMMIEAACSNVFEMRSGRFVTPKLDGRGLAGIVREVILEEIPCIIADISATSHGPLFLTNSLIGVVPVRSVNG
jgi:branched-subunit amino acid aminotransferase/4-amino-4-deoxychorismate lyase